jgi:transposase
VNGGKTTIQKWHAQWNGSAASLQHKQGAGRPRKLSRAQVKQQVERRIVAANRRHEAIHYTTLLPAVQAATHSDVSLRSLQRYGKEDTGVKNKRTNKRTANESKSIESHDRVECE